jgi:hypothetical protein
MNHRFFTDSTAAMDYEEGVDVMKEQAKFNRIMDGIDSVGEKIGIKINKRATWISRSLVFGFFVVVIGIVCFLGALVKNMLGRKD